MRHHSKCLHPAKRNRQDHLRSLSALAWGALGTLILACGGPGPPELPPATLAITHVTVVDGREQVAGEEVAGQEVTVLVNGDRIVAIRAASELIPPPGLPTLEGKGRFLIPGLWDMHVHLANDPEAELEPSRQLALYRAHGVVGVRDMGSDWSVIQALMERLAEGEIPGPEIVSSGPFVDGPQPEGAAVLPVADGEEARQAVRKLAAMGVDFVKIQAKLSREAYFAAVDEAKSQALPFHGHVPDAMTALEVSAAGQRSIEHVSPVLASDAALLFSTSGREDALRRELAELTIARREKDADQEKIRSRYRALQAALVDSYDAEKAAEVFAQLRANGTRVVPTLIWSRSYSPPRADWPDNLPLDSLPAAARERWQGIYEGYFANATEDKLALNEQMEQGALFVIGALHQAGVEVLAGTDSPFGFVIPGFSLHQELEHLVVAGLAPIEALAAATTGPAEFLGLADDRGTVEVGKLADLVLLEADPRSDIRNTRKIAAVIDGGVVTSRQDLDRLLRQVSTQESEASR